MADAHRLTMKHSTGMTHRHGQAVAFSMERPIGRSMCLTIRGLHHGWYTYTMGYSGLLHVTTLSKNIRTMCIYYQCTNVPYILGHSYTPWKIMAYAMMAYAMISHCISHGVPNGHGVCHGLSHIIWYQRPMSRATEQPSVRHQVCPWNNPRDRPWGIPSTSP